MVYWKHYGFTVYDPINTNWHDVGGIYIFARQINQYHWMAFYIGQAKSFRDRLPNHENWTPAVRLGATHIHAMLVSQVANRDMIEAELIEAFQPALNVQLK